MLNDKEKHRYSRHLLLDTVGEAGQEKLKEAKVLVIGAGGLGCPVLQYLTAAGVGTIGIIDFDVVDETNLQRQILFTTADIGKNKALVAHERLTQLNSFVKFELYPEKLTPKNALTIFNCFDLVVDGTDNFSTRYLVNDACILTNKPLIYGAIYKFEGQVSVFNYKEGPTYRCLFPEPPKAGSIPNCSDVGVLGVLPGIIGTHQANETLKIILGIGTTLSGKLLIINALDNSSITVNLTRSEEQVAKVLAMQTEFERVNYDLFCGVKLNVEIEEVTIEELKQMMKTESIQIIDVREEWEQPKVEELNMINIPLKSIAMNLDKIDPSKPKIIVCQKGIRSIAAIDFLKGQGFKNLINLKDGIHSWK